MRTTILIAAALGVTAATSAHAESYGKIFGGGVYGSDHEFSTSVPTVGVFSGEAETDTGYLVGGAYGYKLTDLFSVEGEVAYRSNSLDSATIDGVAVSLNDDVSALSLMVNGVVTAPEVYGFSPYAGGGIGSTLIDIDGDDDFVFSYQAFAGVSRPITDSLSAGVEYRYLATTQDAVLNNTALGARIEAEYEAHSVNLVLTRRF